MNVVKTDTVVAHDRSRKGDLFIQAIADVHPGFTKLDFEGCNRITDVGVSCFAKFRNLSSLNLQGCSLITDAGLVSLTELNYMTTLNLGLCTFSGGVDPACARIRRAYAPCLWHHAKPPTYLILKTLMRVATATTRGVYCILTYNYGTR